MQGLGGGAPTWSVDVHGVCRLWSFLVWCKPGSASPSAPPGAIQHEQPINLQMAANCAGLGGSHAKQNCDLELTTASAVPGVA